MSNKLHVWIANAETDEERGWRLHKIRFQNIKKNVYLYNITCAAAILHFFNDSILKQLLPNFQADFSKFYSKLQSYSFVETLPQLQFCCIHKVNRKWILEDLFVNNRNQFINLSNQATKYFSKKNAPEDRIEWLYHLIVTEQEIGTANLWKIAAKWNNSVHSAELEILINTLMEHVDSERVTGRARGGICFWKGQIALQAKQGDIALETLEIAAQELSEDIDLVLETTRSIGKAQELLGQYEKALENYKKAQITYQKNDDKLNIAKTKMVIGDLQYSSLKQPYKALKSYQEAEGLYQNFNYRLGQARTLEAQGKVRHFLEQYDEELRCYKKAQNLYQEIGSPLYEAQTHKAMSEVYKFLKQPEEYLKHYKKAQELEKELESRWLGLAKNPYDLSDSQFETLKAIFAEPTRTDISLRSIKILLEALGLKAEQNQQYVIFYWKDTIVWEVEPQRDNEIGALEVMYLQDELIKLGYELPF